MTDTDMNNLSLYLEKNYGLTSDRVIAKAIDIVANDNSFHPIIDLLESLKWDGRPRIAGMLTHFFGAENPEYSGEVMKMHMLAAISRLYEPGKKYDIMLCLVGGQGTGKSTFFKYLAIQDEWFTDDVKRLDDKKVYEYLQGHWIVEMSEMNAVANAKSIEETKSFLSRQKDTYRIPYERRAELKIISRQRKDKINELEMKANIIIDENEKIKQENSKLMLEIQNLKTKIENINNTQCTLENQKSNEEVCEQKEKNSNVVIICNDKELIKNQNIIQMTQMEFLLKNEKERKAFEQICVYKKGIHISKLRKIMQLAGEKAIFFESAQELLSFINAMEDKNENRSN